MLVSSDVLFANIFVFLVVFVVYPFCVVVLLKVGCRPSWSARWSDGLEEPVDLGVDSSGTTLMYHC